ncbi:helix-turn-helix transcriptional regulator [Trichloromonas sp.]|uniref:helix-turn-helix transcriptional regulator n=1 Tax=Trichloromonas sp. TaxID=3069249 RepID=UPI003D814414
MNTQPHPTDDRLVSLREITTRYRVSRATIYSWISQGKFPAPTKMGRSSRWPKSVVDEIMRTGVSLEG